MATFNSFKELKRVFSKNPNTYKGGDGVDHIRVSPFGKTDLGRLLSPSLYKKINIRPLGEFSTIRNLWVWLTTDDHPDEFRMMPVKELENVVKFSNIKKNDKIPYFVAIIAYAKYQQLVQHKIELTTSDLPMLMYNETREGFRTTIPYEGWYVAAMKNVLEAYLEKREPVFEVDGKKVDVEKYLREDIMRDLFGDIAPSEPIVKKQPMPKPSGKKKAKPVAEVKPVVKSGEDEEVKSDVTTEEILDAVSQSSETTTEETTAA